MARAGRRQLGQGRKQELGLVTKPSQEMDTKVKRGRGLKAGIRSKVGQKTKSVAVASQSVYTVVQAAPWGNFLV